MDARIENYKFEVTPYTFLGTHGGEERILRLSVKINGVEHTQQRVLASSHVPWQSDLQYFANRATKTLEDYLKEKYEQVGDTNS